MQAKCRYFEDICFSFRRRTQTNSKRGVVTNYKRRNDQQPPTITSKIFTTTNEQSNSHTILSKCLEASEITICDVSEIRQVNKPYPLRSSCKINHGLKSRNEMRDHSIKKVNALQFRVQFRAYIITYSSTALLQTAVALHFQHLGPISLHAIS